MRRLLLAALLTAPYFSQELRVLHLAPADSKALQAAWERKQQADREWNAIAGRIYRDYVVAPAIRTPGPPGSRNPLNGWENGMDFSADFEVAVPRQKAETEQQRHDEVQCPDYNTVPARPWLDVPNR
jgi:hypothetical protein